MPGDPYPFEGKNNPYLDLLSVWEMASLDKVSFARLDESYLNNVLEGTTSVEAADKEGWVASITPSGGWLPACIAGKTGVGMSQRMQSFVLDKKLDPFNVVKPGKRPRVTLTPSMAMKDNKPYLSFAVQGGDSQDQNLLQCFLNMVEFRMTVQEGTEAANINTYQMYASLGDENDRKPKPSAILLNSGTPAWVHKTVIQMAYKKFL